MRDWSMMTTAVLVMVAVIAFGVFYDLKRRQVDGLEEQIRALEEAYEFCKDKQYSAKAAYRSDVIQCQNYIIVMEEMLDSAVAGIAYEDLYRIVIEELRAHDTTPWEEIYPVERRKGWSDE